MQGEQQKFRMAILTFNFYFFNIIRYAQIWFCKYCRQSQRG